MRRAIFGVGVATIAVSLTIAASAFARAGDRPLTQTYPVATALCAKVGSATLPPRLAPQSAAVSAACEALESAFPALVSTVDAAEATLLDAISAQKALIAAACPDPVTNAAACTAARSNAKSTDMAARTTARTAAAAYHTAVEANRVTFWSAISALR
jgi:hypothetical protein